MTAESTKVRELERLLAESRATVAALLSSEIDAVLDPRSGAPVLLSGAQRALLESEERYRRIVETANEGIWTLDREARITFVNRRLADLLGHAVPEIVGRSVFDFLPGEARERVEQRLARARDGASEETEGLVTRYDGTPLWLLIKTSPIHDVEHRYLGVLSMITDRTLQHNEAVEHGKLQAQLMVSDRMVSVGTLAAGVAHEINNPLAAVMANLEFIARVLDGAPDGEGPVQLDFLQELRGPLTEARDAAERVRVIVRDLKIFSRSPVDGPRRPVDVNTTLESSLRMAQHEIRQRARLVRDYGVLPLVEANEARLGQVFLNLLVNAAQALPEGGAEKNQIAVRTRLEAGRVVIEVSDTGVGIPPGLLVRIFDAFFTTKEVGVGTGLGLAISQRIVVDLGGTLTVDSVEGHGSTFRVTLPVGGPAEPPASPSRAAGPAQKATPRRKILVVDDERLVLAGIRRLLASDHDVTGFASAREALVALDAGARFDVILCDLVMPEMTGMDLRRALLHLAPDQAARMIFMTGGAFTAESQRFLAEGTRPFLQKPFDFEHLRALLRQTIAR